MDNDMGLAPKQKEKEMTYARFIIILAMSALTVTGCVVEPIISDVAPRSEPINLRPAEPMVDEEPEPKPDAEPLHPIPEDPRCDFCWPNNETNTLATPDGRINTACQLDPAWSHSAGEVYHGGAFADISLDGRIVVASEHGLGFVEHGHAVEAPMTAFRATDGEPLFNLESDALPLNADPRWQVRAQLEPRCTSTCVDEVGPDGECTEHLQCSGMNLMAVPLLDAEALWTFELDASVRQPAVTMSPSGSRLVLTSCTGRTPQTQATKIRVFGSRNGEVLAEMNILGECLSHFSFNRSHRIVSEHGRYLVIHHGFGSQNDIRVFDLAEHTERTIAFSNERRALIGALSFNHDFSRLMVVSEGEIKQWQFPELEMLPSIPNVGILALNRTSYMPMDVSPLAFSADGLFMAHINTDGQIVVASVATGEVIHTLEQLEFDAAGANSWGNTGREPLQFKFSPDGAGIVVGYTGGFAHFRCAGAVVESGHDELPVFLEGPEQVRVGDTMTYMATHLGNVRTHGHAFFVDGELVAFPSTGRRAALTFDAPGIYEVSVEVLDGLNTGNSSLFVEVR